MGTPEQAGEQKTLTAITPSTELFGGLALSEASKLAQVFAHAAMWADMTDATKPPSATDRAMVKILAARELDLPIVQAMGSLHIIDGRVAMAAQMQGMLAKRSGKYRYDVRRSDKEACELVFFERVDGAWREVGESIFTLDDAEQAKLLNQPRRPAWQTYRRKMLFNRALSQGCSMFCQDALGGAIYDPDELETNDPQTYEEAREVWEAGHVEDVEATVVPDDDDEPDDGDDTSAGEAADPEPSLEPDERDMRPITKSQDNRIRGIARPMQNDDLKRLVLFWTTQVTPDQATSHVRELTRYAYEGLCAALESNRAALIHACELWERENTAEHNAAQGDQSSFEGGLL